MLFSPRNIVIAIFILLQGPFLSAQLTTFTYRLAYDWHTGDTLIYKTFYQCSGYCSPPGQGGSGQDNYSEGSKFGFSVLGKYDSSNAIVYNIWRFDSVAPSQLIIPNADSLINSNVFVGVCPGGYECYVGTYIDGAYPSVRIDSTFNNYLTYNTYYINGGSFSTSSSGVTISERAGVRYAGAGSSSFGHGPPYNESEGFELIYFHTGSVIWNTIPAINSTPTFLYPNPAGDFVFVDVDNNTIGASIQIYDLTGRLMIEEKATLTNNKLNISQLTAGLYLLKLLKPDGTFTTARLVKE